MPYSSTDPDAYPLSQYRVLMKAAEQRGSVAIPTKTPGEATNQMLRFNTFRKALRNCNPNPLYDDLRMLEASLTFKARKTSTGYEITCGQDPMDMVVNQLLEESPELAFADSPLPDTEPDDDLNAGEAAIFSYLNKETDQ